LNLFNPSDIEAIQSPLEFRSFKQGLLIQAFDPDNLDRKTAARSFRDTIRTHSSNQLQLSQTISAASWTKFWRLSLIFTQRNVLYRFIHGEIPNRLLLSQVFPARYSSGDCLLCSTTESIAHFFFDCPTKSAFWELLIREFLWPGATTQTISSCIQHLNFTSLSCSPRCSAKADILIIVALSELWKAHWRFVFDNKPFSPAAVLSNTTFCLERRKAEDQVYRA
jgi:hypothetical protein